MIGIQKNRKHFLAFLALSAFSFLILLGVYNGQVIIDEFEPRTQTVQNVDLTAPFTRNLFYGLRNDPEVVRLQIYLASKGLMSPSLATGNYLTLTRAAVSSLQARYGISPAVGYFGPITRRFVNGQLGISNPNPTPTPISPTPTPISPVPPPVSSDVTQTPPTDFAPKVRPTHQIDPKPSYNLARIAQLVHLGINRQRTNAGLLPLTWDNDLAEVARLHSQDQALDNLQTTNPDILCHYPLIRHEGIRGGYSLSDRFAAANIPYRVGGENIVMFSTATRLLYIYNPNNPPRDCPRITEFPVAQGPREQRLSLFNQVLQEALNAVSGLPRISWINKEWLTEAQIADRAVELWMNSTGHRVNILRTLFNYGGIAIAPVNDYLIITQEFTGR